MSKEEFMNIQTCVLKVNIHCDGCKQKVKKILQKIEGVFTTKIDADQGKVTVSVSGSVDPSVLIEKLAKSGKHAEIWGAPKWNNNPNQTHLANELKGMQIHSEKGGKNNNNDKGPKNGGGGGNSPQQIQKIKGFQDMKLAPQLKDFKGSVPEEDDDFSDDEFTDAGDYDPDDDEFDDLTSQSNKMKPNMMMPNNQQMMMNAQKSTNLGGGPTKNGVKGVSGGGKGEPNGSDFGKGDSGDAGNQSQGGGKSGRQNAGSGHPQDGKNGGGPNAGKKVSGGGGGPMAGGLAAGFLPMRGGGPPDMSMPIGGLMCMGRMADPMGNIPAGLCPMKGVGRMTDPMGNIPAGLCPMKGARPSNMTMPIDGLMSMGDPIGHNPAGLCPMGGAGPSNMTMPIDGPMGMDGLMGNSHAVHVLSGTGASGLPPGYFQGAGPDPIQMQQQQQQYLAAVSNQQRAMGNERFQPMMYARPPPAVSYMPPHLHLHQYQNPYPYPYQYPPHGNDQYSYDENTSSCDIM